MCFSLIWPTKMYVNSLGLLTDGFPSDWRCLLSVSVWMYVSACVCTYLASPSSIHYSGADVHFVLLGFHGVLQNSWGLSAHDLLPGDVEALKFRDCVWNCISKIWNLNKVSGSMNDERGNTLLATDLELHTEDRNRFSCNINGTGISCNHWKYHHESVMSRVGHTT
jgi:hypothetical protein